MLNVPGQIVKQENKKHLYQSNVYIQEPLFHQLKDYSTYYYLLG